MCCCCGFLDQESRFSLSAATVHNVNRGNHTQNKNAPMRLTVLELRKPRWMDWTRQWCFSKLCRAGNQRFWNAVIFFEVA